MNHPRVIAFSAHPHRCDICGDDGKAPGRRLEVHHRDRDRKNNDPANLQILCRPCHLSVHEALRARPHFESKAFFWFILTRDPEPSERLTRWAREYEQWLRLLAADVHPLPPEPPFPRRLDFDRIVQPLRERELVAAP